jgi:mono/diheme cytochrome c family protein/glucose/arabinose dehydrogenase
MVLVRLVAFAALSTAVVLIGAGNQGVPPRSSWPPAVQKVPDHSPVLPPEEALETFFMPPGYRIQLVAAEPLIQEPVAIDWDTAGRLWAVEMPGFMANLMGSNELDPIGRVVVLEDLDDDGRMDTRTVFADGLVLARSLKVLDRGVLVAEPPNVWLMRDTDGDLRADTKDLVTDRYGRRNADPQNNANGFHWALDNRMYTAGQGDVHLRLKGGKFEVHPTLQRGEWGVTEDDAGRIFRNTNESALHVDYVPTAYYARNPGLLRTRGSYERLADEANELNTVWPVRPNPGTNRAYQTGIDREDGTLARFTSVCAPLVYRGDRLPADLYGNVFVAEPAANLVSRIVLDEEAGTIRARKAYERGEFLASTDERFRPVFISNAPDGALYVVDMYRGIIEHRISITVYLRDQILARKLDTPTGLGRIYRVVHDTVTRDTMASGLSRASDPELVRTLSHPNGWRRDTAQRLLIERDAKGVATALAGLAGDASDWRVRLRALWILDGLDSIEWTQVARALDDVSPAVRRAAIRIAERWLPDAAHPAQAAVMQRLDDDDAGVRRQLSASLGALPTGARETAVVGLLERHGEDPITVDAALSGVRGGELAVIEGLVRRQPNTTERGRDSALAMLAATVVRNGRGDDLQRLFAWIADAQQPLGVRSALLQGAEIVLVGATMPGAPARPRPASSRTVPCPTCPGGRAGPGGAYAFGGPPSARGGGGNEPQLRLNREPAALFEVSREAGDLGARAARVLDRVTWPGKPGDVPVAPLTAAQQEQFDAGREVYQNLCQGCHQPDGRGQDRVAPTLIGSRLALGAADIPARILLSGKEGPVGLMPPVGGVLTDEQIASVLTYVRREWGQTGTPVEPSAVADVRKRTAGRTRPWTDAELLRLIDR